MTVFEYFDYEKQLVEDLKAVHTNCAKDAVCNSIVKVLDEHKRFVLDTIREFKARAQENKKHLVQVYRGETPDYVKKLMAEFGFYELEDADEVSSAGKSVIGEHMREGLTFKRIKELCSDGSGTTRSCRAGDAPRVAVSNSMAVTGAALINGTLPDALKKQQRADRNGQSRAKGRKRADDRTKHQAKKQERPE